MRISIVGGGIAGLALAARLDPARFDVTIHELIDTIPATGTVLGMWPAAQRALKAVGVLGAVRAVSPPLESLPVRDRQGIVMATPTVRGMVGIARADLLRLLHDAVPDSVRRAAERVADPDLLDAGLVVGADGVHSVVRRAAWGERAASRLTPVVAVRGVVAEELWREHTGEYWGPAGLFGITRHRDGTNWFAAFRSELGPRGIDVDEALATTRARYAEYAEGVRRVLDAALPAGTLAQRIWVTPALHSYAKPLGSDQDRRAVLVGDAAHAMTPNLGRGACEALIDAVALADRLNTLPVLDALAHYDRARLARTQVLRVASLALMRVALAERAAPARDRVVGLAGRLAPG